jgi:hypothetical protein
MVNRLNIFVFSILVVGALSMTSHASLGTGAMARERMLEHTWQQQLQGAPSPVQRVVKLLEEMKGELEKEAAKDQELYDQMVCWCETSEKEKTKAIADADAKDKDLTSEIEERSAKHGVLSTNMEAAKVEIADETQAAAEAMEIREKDQAHSGQKKRTWYRQSPISKMQFWFFQSIIL